MKQKLVKSKKADSEKCPPRSDVSILDQNKKLSKQLLQKMYKEHSISQRKVVQHISHLLCLSDYSEDKELTKVAIHENKISDKVDPIYSYTLLEEGSSQVRIRWVCRPSSSTSNPSVTEEEHVYEGETQRMRKHGKGTYTITQQLSNGSQKIHKFQGRWKNDLFVQPKVSSNNLFSFSTKNISRKITKNKTLLAVEKQKQSTKLLNL